MQACKALSGLRNITAVNESNRLGRWDGTLAVNCLGKAFLTGLRICRGVSRRESAVPLRHVALPERVEPPALRLLDEPLDQ